MCLRKSMAKNNKHRNAKAAFAIFAKPCLCGVRGVYLKGRLNVIMGALYRAPQLPHAQL